MFWLDNPYVLLDDDWNIHNKIVRLNIILKLAIILSVLLVLISKDFRFILLIIVVGVITVLIKFHYDHEGFDKGGDNYRVAVVDNKVCSASTVDNPFMNPSIADISLNPDRYAACDVELSKKRIDDNFYKEVFVNVNDFYGKDQSLRQFYTVPNTTIPNKQTELARWLYDRGPSCKEGNYERCIWNIGLERNELSMVGL